MRAKALLACCLFLAVLISASNCLAQRRSSNELRLAMSKAQVTSILEKNYKIIKSDDDYCVITSKQGPPLDIIGSLNFSDGKLVNGKEIEEHQRDQDRAAAAW